MTHHRHRGVTIIEAMCAMGVMLIAAIGTLRLHGQQLRLNEEARHITEASALAQDLVQNIALWSYGDSRLSNAVPGNDADIGDTAQAFEGSTFTFDHQESQLGTTWTGLPARAGFTRYWNVAYDDLDGNGVADVVRIAVIVRWQTGSGAFRRLVLVTSKANPAVMQ